MLKDNKSTKYQLIIGTFIFFIMTMFTVSFAYPDKVKAKYTKLDQEISIGNNKIKLEKLYRNGNDIFIYINNENWNEKNTILQYEVGYDKNLNTKKISDIKEYNSFSVLKVSDNMKTSLLRIVIKDITNKDSISSGKILIDNRAVTEDKVYTFKENIIDFLSIQIEKNEKHIKEKNSKVEVLNKTIEDINLKSKQLNDSLVFKTEEEKKKIKQNIDGNNQEIKTKSIEIEKINDEIKTLNQKIKLLQNEIEFIKTGKIKVETEENNDSKNITTPSTNSSTTTPNTTTIVTKPVTTTTPSTQITAPQEVPKVDTNNSDSGSNENQNNTNNAPQETPSQPKESPKTQPKTQPKKDKIDVIITP